MRFPIFIELSEKKAVVFGCGPIGRRRIGALLEYGASVTIIAPEIDEEPENAVCIRKKAEKSDIEGAALVVAATDDREVNRRIGEWCREAGIPVNVADKKEESDFYFPGLAREGNLVAGICADGCDHKLAAEASRAVRELFAEKYRK